MLGLSFAAPLRKCSSTFLADFYQLGVLAVYEITDVKWLLLAPYLRPRCAIEPASYHNLSQLIGNILENGALSSLALLKGRPRFSPR
jgi:hypothetical protein